MIQRLYAHNYRCLENFELRLGEMPSALLIGKNGSGKSTVSEVLRVLQSIGRGVNRIGLLVGPSDFAFGRDKVPMRFEVDVLLKSRLYVYKLALEFPEGFKELRVLEESLSVERELIYSRKGSAVQVPGGGKGREASFQVDWHLVALPIIQPRSESDPLRLFRTWLSRMLVFAPNPSQISGDSQGDTMEPNRCVDNFADWFFALVTSSPASYAQMDAFLRELMPDFLDIKNRNPTADPRSLVVQFRAKDASFVAPFSALSDGEKCFFICALVLAANREYGPILCFWDEPDNYLAMSEVGHFVMALRRSFGSGGQFLATSHNEEAIRRFSEENTLVLQRNSHLEPSVVRPLGELKLEGNLVSALIRGDL